MATLVPVAPTDTFDQWRQKDNAAFNAINNLTTTPGMFQVVDPVNDGDVFIYNAASQTFKNQNLTQIMDSLINSNPSLRATSAKGFYLSSMQTVF